MTIKSFDPEKVNLKFTYFNANDRSFNYYEPCPLIIDSDGAVSIFVVGTHKYSANRIQQLTSPFELVVTMPDGLQIPVPVELDMEQLNSHYVEGCTVALGGLTATQFEVTVLANYGQWWINQLAEQDVFNVSGNPMFRWGAQAAHQGTVFCNWLHDQLQRLGITFEQFSNNVHIDARTLDHIKNCTFVGLPNDVVVAITGPLNMTEQEIVGQLIQIGALEYCRDDRSRNGIVKEVHGSIVRPTSYNLRFDIAARLNNPRR